ncbi:hypothetical protein [robinz microvirus RP_142]|nr:hypothetical protein [robinz microvirus RP_142]
MPRFFRYTPGFRTLEREAAYTAPRSPRPPTTQTQYAVREKERSPGIQKIRDDPQSRLILKDRQTSGPKVALSIATALSRFSEADFSNLEKRQAYRDLRALQNAILSETKAKSSKTTSGEGQRKSTAAGADRRYYNPSDPLNWGSTTYGTAAKVGVGTSAGLRYRHSTSVVPCIDRATRRAVMFALGLGGVGYKTKKGPRGIPC